MSMFQFAVSAILCVSSIVTLCSGEWVLAALIAGIAWMLYQLENDKH
jgi:hypothetical protein